MKAQILTRGPWGIPYKALNVLCPDGVRRTCQITALEPDTAFSIPASCQVNGKTVSGSILTTGPRNEDLEFVGGGKNYTAFGIVTRLVESWWKQDQIEEIKLDMRAAGVPSDWIFSLERKVASWDDSGEFFYHYLVARAPGRSKT